MVLIRDSMNLLVVTVFSVRGPNKIQFSDFEETLKRARLKVHICNLMRSYFYLPPTNPLPIPNLGPISDQFKNAIFGC